MMMLTVDVVISTYKREKILSATLQSMIMQESNGEFNYRILVIDNDPCGSAKTLVEEMSASSLIPIHYYLELRSGLSHARNRGIKESSGDVIVFMDDDILAEKTWLFELMETFKRTGAHCVGGRLLTKWEGDPDECLRAAERIFISLDLGEKDIKLQDRITPLGGNMAFKRTLFDGGVRFPIDLGRVKSNLLGGEESYLFMQFMKNRKMIWYSAKAVVYHRVFIKERSKYYYIRRAYWEGVSRAIIHQKVYGKWYALTIAIARIGKTFFVDIPKLSVATLYTPNIRRFLTVCALAKTFGYFWAIFCKANPSEAASNGLKVGPRLPEEKVIGESTSRS